MGLKKSLLNRHILRKIQTEYVIGKRRSAGYSQLMSKIEDFNSEIQEAGRIGKCFPLKQRWMLSSINRNSTCIVHHTPPGTEIPPRSLGGSASGLLWSTLAPLFGIVSYIPKSEIHCPNPISVSPLQTPVPTKHGKPLTMYPLPVSLHFPIKHRVFVFWQHLCFSRHLHFPPLDLLHCLSLSRERSAHCGNQGIDIP